MQVFTQFTPELISRWADATKNPKTRHPFYDPSWHETWFSQLGTGESLCLISNEKTPSVIPLSIRDGVAHFTGGEEIADYLDRIGPDETNESDWTAAVHELKTQKVSRLVLRNIPDDAKTLDFFRKLPGSVVGVEDTTPILHLPESFEAYLSALSRKDRHEFKRKLKRFETEHPTVRIAVSDTLDIDILLSLMRQNPEKQAFLTDSMEQFFRNLPQAAGSAIRQATLFEQDAVLATTLSFLEDSELLLYNSGYNPAVVGSGWYLKAKLIAWCIDQHIASLNFLQGNERYKYDLGASDFPVYRVELSLG